MEDQSHSSAHTSGSGQSVSVIIGSDILKPFAWFAGVILASCLLLSIGALVISTYAVTSVSSDMASFGAREGDKMADANVNMRQLWYWSQLAYTELHVRGVNLPPPPKPAIFPKPKPERK